MSGPGKIGGGGPSQRPDTSRSSGEKKPPGLEKKGEDWRPPGLAKKSGKGGGSVSGSQSATGQSDGFDWGQFLNFNWLNGGSQGVDQTRSNPWVDPASLNLPPAPTGYSPGSSYTPGSGDGFSDSTRPPVDLGGTTAPGKQLPAFADAGKVPFISQYTPTGAKTDYDGTANCGPAVMAMIAKAAGLQGENESDADLVNRLAAIGGTNEKGTTGNGLLAIAESMGMQAGAVEGANLGWINEQLAAGHRVIANGDFYSIDAHFDKDKASGHYLMVTGYENGSYNVVDPASASTTTMTPSQLQAYMVNQPEGAFALSIW